MCPYTPSNAKSGIKKRRWVMFKRLWLACIVAFMVISCAPGMSDLPKLQEKSLSPDEETRIAAVNDIGRITDATPAVLPILFSALKSDASSRVRAQAAESLKVLRFAESAGPLMDSLKNDGEPIVRKASLDAYYGITGADSYDVILAALKDDSPIVRSGGASILSKFGNDRTGKVLRELLKTDPSSEVRLTVATCLGDLQDKDAFDVLKRAALTDGSSEVRIAATVSIGAIPGEASENFLVDALKNKELQDAAITSMQKNNLGNDSAKAISNLLDITKSSSNVDSRIVDIFLKSEDARVNPYLYRAIVDKQSDRDLIDPIVKRYKQKNDYSFVPKLISDLQDTQSTSEIAHICQALGRFRDPQATPVLLAELQANLENRSKHKSNACAPRHYMWALGEIGDLRAWDYLCKVHCKDHDKDNRQEAGEALNQIYINSPKKPSDPCKCK